jgi:hypothetical protein
MRVGRRERPRARRPCLSAIHLLRPMVDAILLIVDVDCLQLLSICTLGWRQSCALTKFSSQCTLRPSPSHVISCRYTRVDPPHIPRRACTASHVPHRAIKPLTVSFKTRVATRGARRACVVTVFGCSTSTPRALPEARGLLCVSADAKIAFSCLVSSVPSHPVSLHCFIHYGSTACQIPADFRRWDLVLAAVPGNCGGEVGGLRAMYPHDQIIRTISYTECLETQSDHHPFTSLMCTS